jgi:hypothetical protein
MAFCNILVSQDNNWKIVFKTYYKFIELPQTLTLNRSLPGRSTNALGIVRQYLYLFLMLSARVATIPAPEWNGL